MRKIEVGDKFEFVPPDGREHHALPTKGVVYKMTYGKSFGYYSIFVSHEVGVGITVIQSGKIEYGDDTNFVYHGKVSAKELKMIQDQMKPYAEARWDWSKKKKTVEKRGGIEIREDAVLKPNKDYFGHYIEGYIKTKKVWKQIERTTAKMAFFDGGKCSINNVEKVRHMK